MGRIMVSGEQVAQYRETGYLVLPEAVDAEVGGQSESVDHPEAQHANPATGGEQSE